MGKSNKKDVGKGIRALLSNIEKGNNKGQEKGLASEGNGNGLSTVSIKYLEPNPHQPRKSFDEEELADLISSIKTHGIIQPIAVRKLNNRSYQIISGERRWRAAKQLELKTVPVHLLQADDQSMLEMALLENIQRADLNAIEISLSYKQLIDDCNLTHEELSGRLGKKRSSISNYLRLLKLSPSAQNAIKDNLISMGHAKILAGIDHIEVQTLVLGEILRDDLSVRATELIVKSHKSPKRKDKNEDNTNTPIVNSIIKKLSEHIGSKVFVKRSASGKGKITISFFSDDEFNDIVDVILDN